MINIKLFSDCKYREKNSFFEFQIETQLQQLIPSFMASVGTTPKIGGASDTAMASSKDYTSLRRKLIKNQLKQDVSHMTKEQLAQYIQ